jgi:NAD(P)-dependent dehydrogenase (short-subunit alcohol dehydrogenase family)
MRALVVGSSGGIGGALVLALAKGGYETIGLSRSSNGLDVTDEASVARILGGLQGDFDRIFVTTGALELNGQGPEKSLRGLDVDVMMDQFRLNAMGPALVLKHAVRLLPKWRPCSFAALSARVGSIGDNALGGWYSYRAAKAALNQLIHTGAIEVARSHPQAVVVALHPGHVATPLSLKYGGNLAAVTVDKAAENLLGVVSGLTPAQSGGFFDAQGLPIVW